MDTPNARLPRCTTLGCPIRFRSGRDRPCQHHESEGTARLARQPYEDALNAMITEQPHTRE